MRGGMKAYLERGVPGGGFLNAILENDFMSAARKADITNLERLGDYARFLRGYMPRDSYGSPAKVKAWIERGGIKGKESK
jgi:hypothetical protein